MGTKATINVQREDWKILRSWVSHDGYLDGLGQTLLDHYNSYDKALSLVSRGTASSVRDTLENCDFYADQEDEELSVEEIYNLGNLPDITTDVFEEYRYVFKDDKWFVQFGYRDLKELSVALKNQESGRDKEEETMDELASYMERLAHPKHPERSWQVNAKLETIQEKAEMLLDYIKDIKELKSRLKPENASKIEERFYKIKTPLNDLEEKTKEFLESVNVFADLFNIVKEKKHD